MFKTSRTKRRLFLAALALILISTGTATAQEEGQPAVVQRTAIVDINSAPVEQIRGIVLDDVLAQRIIDNRPYANKRRLLSRMLVTDEQYEEIKDRIIARRLAPEPEQ
jgi:DNA uptake protein ComE-like DNA-binding protein